MGTPYYIKVRCCKHILYQRTQPCCEPPQAISAHVRELLGITEAPWSRSIADPPRDARGRFLEKKSRTGEQADRLTYQQFLDDMRQWAQHESQRWRSAAATRTCQRRFISPPVSSWWLRWHTRSGSHARVDINTSHQQHDCMSLWLVENQIYCEEWSHVRESLPPSQRKIRNVKTVFFVYVLHIAVFFFYLFIFQWM